MDTMIWEILATALIFTAGIVAYFEMALSSPTSLLPSQDVTSEREPEEFITTLELRPVTDARTAVRGGVPCQIKRARGKS